LEYIYGHLTLITFQQHFGFSKEKKTLLFAEYYFSLIINLRFIYIYIDTHTHINIENLTARPNKRTHYRGLDLDLY